MTTYSNILAWRIPWTEEPRGLQSMGLQRVENDRVTEQQYTMDLGLRSLSISVASLLDQ